MNWIDALTFKDKYGEALFILICDTQFSKKRREIEDYSFFSLFSLPGPLLQGFGIFGKHLPVKQ
jgi:hypothetical protein